MTFRAAVFDLDGTLADTIPITIKAIKETIIIYTGIEMKDEDILREFGPVDTEIVRKFIPEDKKDEAVECYIRIFGEKFHEYVKPIEGMTDLLKFLKEREMKIGIFTGRGLRVTKIVLEKLRIEEFIETIIAGEHTKKPKPDPEGILLALEKLGAQSSESIYTGDFDVDVLASKKAGTFSVLALWSSTKSEKLKELEPDKYFYSPYEFKEWINNH